MEKILETERESSRYRCLENSLWKRLRTTPDTDEEMNEGRKERTNIYFLCRCTFFTSTHAPLYPSPCEFSFLNYITISSSPDWHCTVRTITLVLLLLLLQQKQYQLLLSPLLLLLLLVILLLLLLLLLYYYYYYYYYHY